MKTFKKTENLKLVIQKFKLNFGKILLNSDEQITF